VDAWACCLDIDFERLKYAERNTMDQAIKAQADMLPKLQAISHASTATTDI
jgi:hypothetical protein